MAETYYRVFNGEHLVAFTSLGYLSPEGYEQLPQSYFWADDTTVTDQTEWITKAVQLSMESNKVNIMILWNLDYDGWDDYNVNAGYALIRKDGSCPTCDALGQLLFQQ